MVRCCAERNGIRCSNIGEVQRRKHCPDRIHTVGIVLRRPLIGIDGSNFRDLYTDTTDQNGVRPQLAWTKDGRTILFTRYPSNQDWQLMRISAEGGTPEFTGLAGKGVAGINLNPDGTRIAFNDGIPAIREFWSLDNLPILKATR